MKVLLILMVPVALAQARPEGSIQQDLGVLNDPFFSSPDYDADAVYGSSTSGVGWADRGASAGGPTTPGVAQSTTPGPIPTTNTKSIAVHHTQTNDAHDTRRSVHNQCPNSSRTNFYVRIGNEYHVVCTMMSEPTEIELNTSSDSGSAARCDSKQNSYGDFGISTVGSEDRLWGYEGSTSSKGILEVNQSTDLSTSTDSGSAAVSDKKENADGEFGTSTVGSEDRSWGYEVSTSSEGIPEVNQSSTTELSTSADSGNASGSDTKQNADGDFGTSTVGPDRSWGYEDSTSSERVPELNHTTTTESSTSSDAGSAGSLFILYIGIFACFICICIGMLIVIYLKKKKLIIYNDIEISTLPAPHVWPK